MEPPSRLCVRFLSSQTIPVHSGQVLLQLKNNGNELLHKVTHTDYSAC